MKNMIFLFLFIPFFVVAQDSTMTYQIKGPGENRVYVGVIHGENNQIHHNMPQLVEVVKRYSSDIPRIFLESRLDTCSPTGKEPFIEQLKLEPYGYDPRPSWAYNTCPTIDDRLGRFSLFMNFQRWNLAKQGVEETNDGFYLNTEIGDEENKLLSDFFSNFSCKPLDDYLAIKIPDSTIVVAGMVHIFYLYNEGVPGRYIFLCTENDWDLTYRLVTVRNAVIGGAPVRKIAKN